MTEYKPYVYVNAVRRSTLKSTQRHVLMVMAFNAGHEGLCFASSVTIGREAGLDPRTVRDTMDALVGLGVLRKVRVLPGKPTTYRLDAGLVPLAETLEADSGVTPDPASGVGEPRIHDPGTPDPRSTDPLDPFSPISDPVSEPIARAREDSPSQPAEPEQLTLNGVPSSASRPRKRAKPKAEDEHHENNGIPKWAKGHGARAHEVLAAVVKALEAIRGTPPNPQRCATDAGPIIRLQRRTGTPWAELADELTLVARWARESHDKRAARDIRAEGWDEGADRSTSVATLCVQERWGDRLDAARHWEAGTGPGPPLGHGGHPSERRPQPTAAELLAKDPHALDSIYPDEADDPHEPDGD